MNRIEKFGKRLKNYKIYFELFALIVIPLAIIYISYQANQISSYQTQIMKTEQCPILYFETEYIFDREVEKYTSKEMIIYNLGKPLSEFESEYFIFLKVGIGKEGEGGEKIAKIPLFSYYNFSILTNNSTGELIRIKSNIEGGNNEKIRQMDRDLVEFLEKKNMYLSRFDVIILFKIGYRDILGEYHCEYYQYDYRQHKLSQTEGEKIIEDWTNKWKKGIYIELSPELSQSKITSEFLYEKWLVTIGEKEE